VAAEPRRSVLGEAVAQRLVAYRQANGLSQQALAQRLRTHQPLVARLEAGTHTPTLATLQRLAGVLGEPFTLRVGPDGVILLSPAA
jgi:transcriptional regulator with XRE-family HTH domain